MTKGPTPVIYFFQLGPIFRNFEKFLKIAPAAGDQSSIQHEPTGDISHLGYNDKITSKSTYSDCKKLALLPSPPPEDCSSSNCGRQLPGWPAMTLASWHLYLWVVPS